MPRWKMLQNYIKYIFANSNVLQITFKASKIDFLNDGNYKVLPSNDQRKFFSFLALLQTSLSCTLLKS